MTFFSQFEDSQSINRSLLPTSTANIERYGGPDNLTGRAKKTIVSVKVAYSEKTYTF